MMPLMRALDTLVLLDSIKDTKACFSNDFAAYERAFQVCGYGGNFTQHAILPLNHSPGVPWQRAQCGSGQQ